MAVTSFKFEAQLGETDLNSLQAEIVTRVVLLRQASSVHTDMLSVSFA